MPLSKGFLRRKGLFQENPTLSIWTSIVVAIFLSYSFFAFASVMRELFRFACGLFGGQEPMILTSDEQNFFNLFFASYSILICGGYVFRQLLLYPATARNIRRSFRLSMATDQQNVTALSLYLFARLGMFYGVFTWMSRIDIFIAVYEHRWILILFVVVLFLNQWLTMNRVYGKHSIKLMSFVFVIWIGLSFLFTQITPVDHQRLDNAILKRYASYYYTLNIPPSVSEAGNIMRRDDPVTVHLGFDKKNDTATAIMLAHIRPFDPVDSSFVIRRIKQTKSYFMEHEQDLVSVKIIFDEHVTIGDFKNLENILRITGVSRAYSALRDSSGLTKYFPKIVRTNCDEYLMKPDSTDWRAEYCTDQFGRDAKFIVLSLKNNVQFVDGSRSTVAEVHEMVKSFIRSNKLNGVVLIHTDDASRYFELVSLDNAVRSALRDVQDEIVRSRYDFSFRESMDDPYNDEYRQARDFAYEQCSIQTMYLSDLHLEALLKKRPHLKSRFR
jgi:hypothetical protein